jgi:hypothetical protein
MSVSRVTAPISRIQSMTDSVVCRFSCINRLAMAAIIAMSVHAAPAEDNAVKPRPHFCRVLLDVDESGKGAIAIREIGAARQVTRPDALCSRHPQPDGFCKYSYYFSDPNALKFLTGAYGKPLNVYVDKDLHCLRMQPAAGKGYSLPCALVKLPYRVSIPFKLEFDVAVPDEADGAAYILLTFSPHHHEESADEPIQFNLGLSSEDHFRSSASVLTKSIYAQESAKDRGKLESRDVSLAIGGDAAAVSFLMPLPMGAKSPAYAVHVGAAGAIAVNLARLAISTIPQPPAGCALQQIGDSVVVGDVADPSPARNAGVKAGDQLLSINGREIFRTADALSAIALSPPGKDMCVEVVRRGEKVSMLLAMREPNQPPDVDAVGERGDAPERTAVTARGSSVGEPASAINDSPMKATADATAAASITGPSTAKDSSDVVEVSADKVPPLARSTYRWFVRISKLESDFHKSFDPVFKTTRESQDVATLCKAYGDACVMVGDYVKNLEAMPKGDLDPEVLEYSFDNLAFYRNVQVNLHGIWRSFHKISQMAEYAQSTNALAEALISGLAGDPTGPAVRVMQAQSDHAKEYNALIDQQNALLAEQTKLRGQWERLVVKVNKQYGHYYERLKQEKAFDDL